MLWQQGPGSGPIVEVGPDPRGSPQPQLPVSSSLWQSQCGWHPASEWYCHQASVMAKISHCQRTVTQRSGQRGYSPAPTYLRKGKKKRAVCAAQLQEVLGHKVRACLKKKGEKVYQDFKAKNSLNRLTQALVPQVCRTGCVFGTCCSCPQQPPAGLIPHLGAGRNVCSQCSSFSVSFSPPPCLSLRRTENTTFILRTVNPVLQPGMRKSHHTSVPQINGHPERDACQSSGPLCSLCPSHSRLILQGTRAQIQGFRGWPEAGQRCSPAL